MKMYLNTAVSVKASGENWTALQSSPVSSRGDIKFGASRNSTLVEEGQFIQVEETFYLNCSGVHAINGVDCGVKIDPEKIRLLPLEGEAPGVNRPELYATQLRLRGESLRREICGEQGTWESALAWLWEGWVILPIREKNKTARAYARQEKITAIETQKHLDNAWTLVQAHYTEFCREFPAFSEVVPPPMREEIEGKTEQV